MINDAAIVTQVTGDSAVAALIGTRLYPEYVKQKDKVYPYAVYKIENVDAQLASDGPTGLESADVIIACVAPTKIAAGQVAQAVQNALNGQAGTWAGTVVQGCFLKEDGIDDNVVTEPQSEAIIAYVKEVTFQIWYANK